MSTCVAIVAVDPVGRVALSARRNDPASWALPGGKAEAGETPREAARRELKEEVGLDVAPSQLHFITTVRRPDGPGTVSFFWVDAPEVPLKASPGEPECRWGAWADLFGPTCPFAAVYRSVLVEGRLG